MENEKTNGEGGSKTQVYKKNGFLELAFFLPSLFILAFVVVLIIYLKTKNKVNYLAGATPNYTPTVIAISLILVGAVVVKVLRLITDKMIVTPEQVVVKTGVILKKTEIINLADKVMVETRLSTLKKIYCKRKVLATEYQNKNEKLSK